MQTKRDTECQVEEVYDNPPPADCCRTLELAPHEGSETIRSGRCACGGMVTESVGGRWYSTPERFLYWVEATNG